MAGMSETMRVAGVARRTGVAEVVHGDERAILIGRGRPSAPAQTEQECKEDPAAELRTWSKENRPLPGGRRWAGTRREQAGHATCPSPEGTYGGANERSPALRLRPAFPVSQWHREWREVPVNTVGVLAPKSHRLPKICVCCSIICDCGKATVRNVLREAADLSLHAPPYAAHSAVTAPCFPAYLDLSRASSSIRSTSGAAWLPRASGAPAARQPRTAEQQQGNATDQPVERPAQSDGARTEFDLAGTGPSGKSPSTASTVLPNSNPTGARAVRPAPRTVAPGLLADQQVERVDRCHPARMIDRDGEPVRR